MADIFPAFMAPRIWGRWSHTHRYFTTEHHHHNLSRGNSARKKSRQKITDGSLEGRTWFDKFLIFSYFPIFCSKNPTHPLSLKIFTPVTFIANPHWLYYNCSWPLYFTCWLRTCINRIFTQIAATSPFNPRNNKILLSRDANNLFSKVEKVWQRILAGRDMGQGRLNLLMPQHFDCLPWLSIYGLYICIGMLVTTGRCHK